MTGCVAAFKASFTTAEYGHKQNEPWQENFTSLYGVNVYLYFTIFFIIITVIISPQVDWIKEIMVGHSSTTFNLPWPNYHRPSLFLCPVCCILPLLVVLNIIYSTKTLLPIGYILSFQGWQAGHKS